MFLVFEILHRMILVPVAFRHGGWENLGQNLNIASLIVMYNFSILSLLLWPSGLSTGFEIRHMCVRFTSGANFFRCLSRGNSNFN